MNSKYTANAMIKDINMIKEFYFCLAQQENRNEVDRKYHEGFANGCAWALSLFKGYLEDNAKGANNAI